MVEERKVGPLTIKDNVVVKCDRLYSGSIIIPDGVTEINCAFSGCTALASVTIPNSVTRIGLSAFEYCTSLKSIIIPNSVTSVGMSAFEGCTSLANITIPDSVTSIGRGAFLGCTSLTNITIPDSITNIDSAAFCGCNENLTFKCGSASYAAKYAETHGINIEYTDKDLTYTPINSNIIELDEDKCYTPKEGFTTDIECEDKDKDNASID